MAQIAIGSLTFEHDGARWTAHRKFPFLPCHAPPVPANEQEEAPTTFDVLLTGGSENIEELIQVCAAEGIERAAVELALADRPRFLVRNVAMDRGHMLVMKIMQAGGLAELHPHEPDDGAVPRVRPSSMDEQEIESTRQMADFIAQQLQLRRQSGTFPNMPEGMFDGMLASIDNMKRQQQHGDDLRRRGLCTVFIDMPDDIEDEDEGPSPEQVAALEFFLAHEESHCSKVLDAVFRYYTVLRKAEPELFEDDDAVSTVEDLLPLLDFNGLAVRADSLGGDSLLGFSFDADWEPEHGLGVCMHGDTVLDVGDWECGQCGPFPDSSLLIKRASTRGEKIQAQRAAKEIASRQGPPASMSDVMQMMQAAMSGHPGGPSPLFAAIESTNVESVRYLLQQGADTSSKHRYSIHVQTPLEFARESLDNYSHSLALQTRELEGLKQLAAAPEGTSPSPTTLAGAFHSVASQLANLVEGDKARSTAMPKEYVEQRIQYFQRLVDNTRQSQAALVEIVALLENATGKA